MAAVAWLLYWLFAGCFPHMYYIDSVFFIQFGDEGFTLLKCY